MQVKNPHLQLLILTAGLCLAGTVWSQQGTSPPSAPAAPAELPPVPQGVEVLTRGPVHEAFATPTTEPVPTTPVTKAPPKPLEEMPPEQKPEGAVVWIGGYWAWDDDRKDYLWVSGTWRTAPPGKRWVAGYWREEGTQWQWVPGFWSQAEAEKTHQQVAYLPQPPAPPEVARPGEPPAPNSFYVPGAWVWVDGRYVWRAGYWAQVQPGYVWVSAHYRWTPSGYVFIPGYWDLALDHRGVLYTPVIVNHAVVGATFVYTPAYVVREPVVVDSLFVRPCYCHYYFGDYYGPAYRELGFESCVVYSRAHYEPIYVYARWEHRDDPRWETTYLDITLARHAGRAPLPPRTLVQYNTIINQTNVNVTNVNVYQNTVVHNGPMVVPASQLATVKKINTVTLDPAARMQARQQAQVVQQVAAQRHQLEKAAPAGAPLQPRVATLQVPPHEPIRPAAAANRPVAPTGLAAPTTARTPNLPPGAKPAPQRPLLQRPQPKPGPKDKDKDKEKDKQPPK
jgi:hypothetical protein